jgi:cell division protein FtsA
MIIYERAHELMKKTYQHLNSRGLTKHLIRGVVLTGGSASIINYAKLAESVFQVPCRVGLPTGVEIVAARAREPQFSGVVGVARHGFDYRTATRSGRISFRGPVAHGAKRIGEAFKKYFF